MNADTHGIDVILAEEDDWLLSRLGAKGRDELGIAGICGCVLKCDLPRNRAAGKAFAQDAGQSHGAGLNCVSGVILQVRRFHAV